jgi:hypothetical protein
VISASCTYDGGHFSHRYAAKLPAAEAVPTYLRLGKIDEARKIALENKVKQPELIKSVIEHSAS